MVWLGKDDIHSSTVWQSCETKQYGGDDEDRCYGLTLILGLVGSKGVCTVNLCDVDHCSVFLSNGVM
jgi:hypothetical protein